MLKQHEECLFRQLAFSASVVAASEEVRVGIVVLIVVDLLNCSPRMLVGGL